MAGSSSDVQNPFNCSICLELFKDPVTTSCGHSFCMNCIKSCWDKESLRGVYSCPTCRNGFRQRPTLSKNTVLAGIVEERKQDAPAAPGDVQCDVCIGRKIKAVKSCLVCLASFCQTHLQPHYQSQAFKKHKLVNASANLQQQICPQHHKALEIYCYNDKKCICVLCLGDQHSGHKTVSAITEMAKEKEKLKIKKTEFIKKITDINKNLQAFKKPMDLHKSSAQTSVEHSNKIFTELIQSLTKKQTEVREKIRAQEKQETQKATNYIQKQKQEISNLRNQSVKLEQVLHTEDHIYFFQNFSSLSPRLYVLPKDVNDLVTFEKIDESVSKLKRKLDEVCEKHMGKISNKVADVHIIRPFVIGLPSDSSESSEASEASESSESFEPPSPCEASSSPGCLSD
ncbi:E3 ubiquitin/ISG15 ligase TRIM25 [Danio rerio]|uniref:E3 ubiquitin/ISG15 ligase TRIM25 n=2 Tax=Danio rerio TaxID=7955 RepID=A0A8M6Z2E5_DANRE|nr:E3 ubiquitin/ISG15 ligase TRIM25 [Danio rerio]|eukprot:XP_017214343.1 E3 ubiquitin/ISG15 ligase TRIM25 [Danio rerio]